MITILLILDSEYKTTINIIFLSNYLNNQNYNNYEVVSLFISPLLLHKTEPPLKVDDFISVIGLASNHGKNYYFSIWRYTFQ